MHRMMTYASNMADGKKTENNRNPIKEAGAELQHIRRAQLTQRITTGGQ
jgi:hypothetical protein